MSARNVDPYAKMKRTAILLSLIPGVGQLRNRQVYKFWFYLPATIIFLGIGVLLLAFGPAEGTALLKDRSFLLFLIVSFGSVILAIFAIILGLYVWASAAVDTYHSERGRLEGNEDANRWWFFQL